VVALAGHSLDENQPRRSAAGANGRLSSLGVSLRR
jgi:hypothetical protein